MEDKSAYHHKMQHNQYQETHEEEGEQHRLSFCDLPIYSSEEASPWELNDDSPDDSFEFFCQERIDSATPSEYRLQDNITFCGKLIPSKDLPVPNMPDCSPIKKPTKKRRIFLWNYKLFRKPKSDQTKSGHDSDGNGPSVVMTSPVKSRWINVLMFGLMKLPAEADLSYAKNMQQRRRSPGGSKLLPVEDVHCVKVLGGLIWALRYGSDPITTTGSTTHVVSSAARFDVHKPL